MKLELLVSDLPAVGILIRAENDGFWAIYDVHFCPSWTAFCSWDKVTPYSGVVIIKIIYKVGLYTLSRRQQRLWNNLKQRRSNLIHSVGGNLLHLFLLLRLVDGLQSIVGCLVRALHNRLKHLRSKQAYPGCCSGHCPPEGSAAPPPTVASSGRRISWQRLSSQKEKEKRKEED